MGRKLKISQPSCSFLNHQSSAMFQIHRKRAKKTMSVFGICLGMFGQRNVSLKSYCSAHHKYVCTFNPFQLAILMSVSMISSARLLRGAAEVPAILR